MPREARREGGVRLLCNPIDGAQDQEMERARVARRRPSFCSGTGEHSEVGWRDRYTVL